MISSQEQIDEKATFSVPKGAKKYHHLLGLQEFILRVEKDKLKRMVDDDNMFFEKILPYAIVLGIADEWAEKFKDLTISKPSWFQSEDGLSTFHSRHFVSELNQGISSMNSTLSSAPRSSSSAGISTFSSSGGGFSGGGYGGGGGGSW